MIAKNSVETSATAPGKNPGAMASRPAPSPALLFDTINAYQKTAAIKAAIELDVFTTIGDGPATAETMAARCHASPRGLRILCDYLTILGFLTKSGDRYAPMPDSALFLNRKSPAYAGGTLEFLLSNDLKGAFDQLTEAARKGGTAQSQHGTMAPEHPVWLPFARSMGPLMAPAAAGFSLVMLATTSEGDAYTFAECSNMLAQVGFNPPTLHTLPASMNVAVIARK